MVNFLTATGAFLGLASHVLIATAIATNFWLIFRDRAIKDASSSVPLPTITSSIPRLNPIRNSTGFLQSDFIVNYRADHLGIWVSCYKEMNYGGKVSCGFIDHACQSKICWVRKGNGTDRVCKRGPVTPLVGKCTAFQAVRGMAVVGTFLSIVGTTFLFVSLCVMTRLFSFSGGFCTLFGALCLMSSFAVFLGAVYNDGNLIQVARTGYSFKLLIASWVVAVFAAILACTGGAVGRSKNDDIDYDSE